MQWQCLLPPADSLSRALPSAVQHATHIGAIPDIAQPAVDLVCIDLIVLVTGQRSRSISMLAHLHALADALARVGNLQGTTSRSRGSADDKFGWHGVLGHATPLLSLTRSPSNFLFPVTPAPGPSHTCFKLFSGMMASESSGRHFLHKSLMTHRHRQLCATLTIKYV